MAQGLCFQQHFKIYFYEQDFQVPNSEPKAPTRPKHTRAFRREGSWSNLHFITILTKYHWYAQPSWSNQLHVKMLLRTTRHRKETMTFQHCYCTSAGCIELWPKKLNYGSSSSFSEDPVNTSRRATPWEWCWECLWTVAQELWTDHSGTSQWGLLEPQQEWQSPQQHRTDPEQPPVCSIPATLTSTAGMVFEAAESCTCDHRLQDKHPPLKPGSAKLSHNKVLSALGKIISD